MGMAEVLTRLMPSTPSRLTGQHSAPAAAVTNDEVRRARPAVAFEGRHEDAEPEDKPDHIQGEEESDEEEESELQEDGGDSGLVSGTTKTMPDAIGGAAEGEMEVSADGIETSEEQEEVELSEEEDEEEEGSSDADDEADDSSSTRQSDRPKPLVVISDRNPQGREANQEVDDEDEDAASTSTSSESEASDASSNAENEWDGDSAGEGEDDLENTDPNRCVFCNEGEDQDPSEEFEEYLACAACGDNAHRQCARDADTLSDDEDAESWRCPSCVDNDVEPDRKASTSVSHQRRSSAPKIARDLLPAQRGSEKPGSHTIFANLILDDDPMDGSRSLRKRKSSEAADDRAPTEVKKRARGPSEDSNKSQPHKPGSPGPSTTFTEQTAAPLTAASPRLRPSRTRNLRSIIERPPITVIESSEDTLILSFNLEPAKLATLERDRKRRRRRERDQRRRDREAQPQEQLIVSHYPALRPGSFHMSFFSLNDRDGDTNKSKPYGGILSEAEADTTKTFPQVIDRRKFEDARLKAEDRWRQKVEAANALEVSRPARKLANTGASQVTCIHFGQHEIDTWHQAPYPEEYNHNKIIYICEFCLKYMNSDFVAWRHKLKCPAKHPPGDEIYRDGNFSFFEVDGRKNPVYCQNLCLLAKLFLGSKTLYYDVEPFLFYVMTENDKYGNHFVGYFSKEKRPSSLNNVSCILVLPIHQRRGFGHYLIEFSYLLTRVEQKTGSPEKPLSDMGLVSYRSYWRLIMCQQLLHQKESISINDISDKTGMTADDIVSALEALRALVRDPVTKAYALRLDYAYYRQYIENYERKEYYKVNPDALVWVPYVMGKDNQHYENAAPLHTVAQREEPQADVQPEEGVQQLAANGISDKDYAVTNTESQASISAPATPQGEENSGADDEYPTTPFPPLELDHNAQDVEGNQVQTVTKIPPTTPFTKASSNGELPIPATRFEIFPPLPGTSARKRLGRPPLGRPSHRRGTPQRRESLATSEAPDSALNPGSGRRTRSKLAEVEVLSSMDTTSPLHKPEEETAEDEDEAEDHTGDAADGVDGDAVMHDA